MQGMGVVAASHLPSARGWDVAGIVTERGSDVKNFKVGDEVCGMPAFPHIAGCFAEYIIADENDLAKKPANISFEEAAAYPLVSLTAWQALIEFGELKESQRVLIHAAAGGVGHIAVKIAHHFKDENFGTASHKKEKMLKDLGLTHFIDYQNEQFDHVANDLDLVLDTMGGDIAHRSLAILKNTGRFVTLLGHGQPEILEDANKRGIANLSMLVSPNGAQMANIAKLIEKNALTIHIDRTFNIQDANEAFDLLSKGHTSGKIVLTPFK